MVLDEVKHVLEYVALSLVLIHPESSKSVRDHFLELKILFLQSLSE